MVMKKIKGVYGLAYTVVIGFFLSSFALFAENDANLKKSCEYQECSITTDALGWKRIHIESPLLEECIAVILYDSVREGTERFLSEEFMVFCEKILNKQTEFEPEEVAQILPELTSFIVTSSKTARESCQNAEIASAPGDPQGSEVDPEACNNAQVLQLLNQLFMLLQQCCNTIQIDFAGTFTVLATLIEDFGGTFTVINDIKNTVITDFNGTFTALAACCNQTFIDFTGVFTSLTDIKNTLTVDFNGTFTVLNAIVIDFESTITVINDIKSTLTIDFNGTFTALAACCNQTFVDFTGVFTSLTDIKNTLTVDFNGTFTALAACCNQTFVDFNGVFTVLTDIHETVTTDFNGTFTVFNVLATIIDSPCKATPITAPTTIIVPGSYCLENDIVGTVSIAASNVTVDLNNHTISAPGQVGVFVTAVSNVMVTNGRIDTTAVGIELINGTDTIILSNISITNCSDSGIVINPACVATFIFDTTITTVANFGIHFVNGNDNSQCKRVRLVDCKGAVGIGTTGSISSSLFEDCQIVDCVSNVVSCTFFNLENGQFNQLTRCSVTDVQNNGGSLTALNIGSQSTTLESCILQGITSITNKAYGYVISGSTSVLEDCSALAVESLNGSVGFLVTGSTIMLNNCLVQTVSAITIGSVVTGFDMNGPGANLINCQAYQITGTGFHVEASAVNSSLLNCEANNNGANGFGIDSILSFIGNCTSLYNGSYGFSVPGVGTTPVFGCFAHGNGVMNYLNVPNVQSVGTQVGVFARGNDFI